LAEVAPVRDRISACFAWFSDVLGVVAQATRESAPVWNTGRLPVDFLLGDAFFVQGLSSA
jgi:hypothetical protein